MKSKLEELNEALQKGKDTINSIKNLLFKEEERLRDEKEKKQNLCFHLKVNTEKYMKHSRMDYIDTYTSSFRYTCVECGKDVSPVIGSYK